MIISWLWEHGNSTFPLAPSRDKCSRNFLGTTGKGDQIFIWGSCPTQHQIQSGGVQIVWKTELFNHETSTHPEPSPAATTFEWRTFLWHLQYVRDEKKLHSVLLYEQPPSPKPLHGECRSSCYTCTLRRCSSPPSSLVSSPDGFDYFVLALQYIAGHRLPGEAQPSGPVLLLERFEPVISALVLLLLLH
jgi:hypothetical protein